MYQLELPVAVKKHILEPPLDLISENEKEIIIAGEDFQYRFSKLYGSITGMVRDGKELLVDRVRLTVHRAPTDNDRAVKSFWNLYGDTVMAENLNRLFTKVYECAVHGNTVTVKGALSGISRTPCLRFETEYAFYRGGEVRVTLNGKVKEEMESFLPRLGFEFTLKKPNDGFTYFGCGKQESYCDMHYHTKAGIYESTAAEEYIPYPMPQEHGNHWHCKWLKMNSGLEFFTDDFFEFSVSEYTSYMLEQAKHTDELEKNGFTNVRIDYKNSGIGSASCGPGLIEQYRLDEKEIHFSFFIH